MNHRDAKLFPLLLKCTHFSFRKTSTAAASTCLRSVSWMELVGGCMNPSPVLDFWAKPAWWSPEPSVCARWQLGDRVPGQASAALALVLWPPPLFLQARHRRFWPAHFSWSTCGRQLVSPSFLDSCNLNRCCFTTLDGWIVLKIEEVDACRWDLAGMAIKNIARPCLSNCSGKNRAKLHPWHRNHTSALSCWSLNAEQIKRLFLKIQGLILFQPPSQKELNFSEL